MNNDVKALEALASQLRQSVEAIGRLLVDPRIAVRMDSPDQEVSVAVDADGRLLRLQLAPGSTNRMSYKALEAAINETLAAAAQAAASAKLAQAS